MITRPALLLITDDVAVRDQIGRALAPDYDLIAISDRTAALSHASHAMPPLVVWDVESLSAGDTASEPLSILQNTLRLNHEAKVIVVIGNSARANAISAIESGAYDVLEKPVQLDVLKVVLQRATYLSNLERESRESQVQSGGTEFEGLVGNSKPMQDVFSMIRRVGPSDVSVLITGESGTGKELVARAIHRLSARKEAPFIAINCGAIPETLLESEFFGYEKGAFTGATQQKKGRIESAQRGTLFLDEIGEMPLSLQVKLLRFLQDHEIHRLGGKDPVSVDVRVLAATNVDLREAIESGRFREDLFYRLCVVTIPVPALKGRADITLLARTFLMKSAEAQEKRLKGFTPQAIDALLTHDWPGNVRELENRVRRAVVMADGKYVSPENLDLKDPSSVERASTTLRVTRDLREKKLVQSMLEKTHGNVSKAAVDLGISRPTLYQLLARYGLRDRKFIDKQEKRTV
ncbi:MAG: PEP-CTERM-box response regulator transcription factor [Nitrospira sp.]|nr:PEP-CTERM-box response regulator transcription factor [Nitrospira sp.]MDH4371669.1 PEP-CTERM-box response regulator transcription factor [Nitrospira sp.]